jgi:hypothetical protein
MRTFRGSVYELYQDLNVHQTHYITQVQYGPLTPIFSQWQSLLSLTAGQSYTSIKSTIQFKPALYLNTDAFLNVQIEPRSDHLTHRLKQVKCGAKLIVSSKL